ncbi:MAG TPA: SAM-dependent chlorinase/fluorinase [Candidatus Binataceae bacterium]|nr:SAM-dependent chlorinase/fluorinase [Candidatus Binataceae bacterium]
MVPKESSDLDPIAILSDFGYRDHYAGVMKGVIASIAPAAQVIDITHGIPAQQIAAGALILSQSWRFFPPRTIFLAVVDPGVGTDRLPIAIETRAGARLVGPDNGLLAPVAHAAGIEQIVELRNPEYRLPAASSTFHGRDIFAPAAAWIARGVPPDTLGPRIDSIEELDLAAGVMHAAHTLAGRVIYVDTYGNLVTNLSRQQVQAFAEGVEHDSLWVRVGGSPAFKVGGTYAEVAVGGSLALFGSFEMLEIAVRDGDAAAVFKAGIGAPVIIEKAEHGKKKRH